MCTGAPTGGGEAPTCSSDAPNRCEGGTTHGVAVKRHPCPAVHQVDAAARRRGSASPVGRRRCNPHTPAATYRRALSERPHAPPACHVRALDVQPGDPHANVHPPARRPRIHAPRVLPHRRGAGGRHPPSRSASESLRSTASRSKACRCCGGPESARHHRGLHGLRVLVLPRRRGHRREASAPTTAAPCSLVIAPRPLAMHAAAPARRAGSAGGRRRGVTPSRGCTRAPLRRPARRGFPPASRARRGPGRRPLRRRSAGQRGGGPRARRADRQ